jgi:predicted aspartyl protease
MRTLLLVLLVIGCAPAGPCRLQQVANLPATVDAGRLEMTGRVNRVDTQLIVDTGAERTVLTMSTINELLLARSRLSRNQLTGVSGAVNNADVFADLQLGNENFAQRFAVTNVPGLHGLIGVDLLGDYDVELDIPGRRVRLWKPSSCGANDLPWSGPRSELPVHMTWNSQLIVTVKIDGKPVNALLDSGASISLLQTGTARRLGVTQAALAADPEVSVHGADGGSINVRIHRFGTVGAGNYQIANPQIGVGESQLISPEMLLGLDYLRNRRVWISYRAERVFIQ